MVPGCPFPGANPILDAFGTTIPARFRAAPTSSGERSPRASSCGHHHRLAPPTRTRGSCTPRSAAPARRSGAGHVPNGAQSCWVGFRRSYVYAGRIRDGPGSAHHGGHPQLAAAGRFRDPGVLQEQKDARPDTTVRAGARCRCLASARRPGQRRGAPKPNVGASRI